MDDYSNILIDLFDLTLISARQKGGGLFIIIRVCTILVLLATKRGKVGTHVLTIDI